MSMTSHAHALPANPAPWAEIVPDVGPMTMDEFLDYPDGDDGYCYELVDGVLVRMVGTRPRAVRITMLLLDAVNTYVKMHDLGQVTPPDAVYDFEQTGQKDTGLLPDIGFYYASREPLVDPDKPYPFAPDLAVEVASPTQYRPGMKAKVERYLAGGTALVWVVWPQRQQVDVWRTGDTQPATLGVDGILDGETVIPGFTCPIADLFA
jgi:Uma2 family endonuclease